MWGVISEIYHGQVARSKTRNHPLPTYTKQGLRSWMMSQKLFIHLYCDWVNSGYMTRFRPSIDRIDDYKGYSFDNIKLTTWLKNRTKGHNDIINGVNRKRVKPVIQMELDETEIAEFYSAHEASRRTGVSRGNISSNCGGLCKTAGGYKWRFKTSPPNPDKP